MEWKHTASLLNKRSQKQRSVKKFMPIVFWNRKGPITIDSLLKKSYNKQGFHFSNLWQNSMYILSVSRIYIYIYIYIYIIILIIMPCHRHWYPWPSLATSPYRSLPLAGLQGCISYPHIAAGCMFELVVLLSPGHMWGSIGVHHLWARPYFSSSDLHVWFV